MRLALFLYALTLLSHCFAQTVNRNQTVIAGEYYIDSDPGEGKGNQISATYGSYTVNATFNLNIPYGSLAFIRFKSSDGLWSEPLTIRGDVFEGSGATIVRGEYFINSDPGIGNGISESVESGNMITLPHLKLNRGNIVYVRAQDSFLRWSPPRPINYMFKNIIDAQYYIKYSSGMTTSLVNMTVRDSLQNYPVFVASSNPIATLSAYDTVFVRVMSDDYLWSEWAASSGVTTAINEHVSSIPNEFALCNAYPNPFNPTTTISYSIPRTSTVTIKIFDILGREITTLVNEEMMPGNYEIKFDGSNLSSGVYFYRLQAGEYSSTKKFLLLK